jgi:hypothetical protein
MFSPVGADAYGAPGWSADQFRDIAGQMEALGVTMLAVHIPAPSRAEYCDLLAGFGSEVISR